jgi:putative PIN family toxin of toxin-antitoxin system
MRVKCVVDTDVLISAALTKGAPFRILEHLINNNALIFSKETISELSSRITQSKFDKYVSSEDREAYVNNLILSADLVIIDNLIQGCRDRDDDKFLETAVKGDARFIISGDQDLLTMHRFEGIDIVTVQEFAVYTV